MTHSVIQQVAQRLISCGLAHPNTMKGCSKDEIERLEDHFGTQLPEVYRDFLSVMGQQAGDYFFAGTDMFYDSLFGLRRAAEELLKCLGSSYSLPKEAFVFLMDQGYQFMFFHTGQSQDPAVFHFIDSEATPSQIFETFSAWLLRSVQDHEVLASMSGEGEYYSKAGDGGKPQDNGTQQIDGSGKGTGSSTSDEPIHSIAASGQTNELVTLLMIDAQLVHAKGKWDETPLHKVSTAAIAQVLLNHGADVNAAGWMGATPLHSAAGKGLVDVVSLLIQRGANVNAQRPERKDTPLHFAANDAVAKLLINSGAEVEARDKSGGTPLHWAAQFGRTDVVRRLIVEGAGVNAQCCRGETPLHWAAQEGQVDAARELLRHGAEVNAVNKEDRTPLHMAAFRGQNVVVEVLVPAGADVRRRSYWGKTPLDEAEQNHHLQTANLLRSYQGLPVLPTHAKANEHIP